ncbi:hypothetical protein RO3G_09237 [Rhizopus delemar RA 99-880]|uniref:Uncharacterized protein n=1 Tax=Rhizopus delemar (strain RA 99-880 / ATCC MYA-4621 / FGSC 9543 / NRRL 43880) TaxID=246409 RepID=I1C7U7_RHIO9|nr:hypothetical protein RO3G_09237 [Rhizopus delemar RA 99-880]|eukprot:EIE84527.1 hypothetical protein RO3G_09237 [Rhizopus delemar RA 99-880]
MSTRFFYEDEQGKLVNEEDNDEMAWDAESQPFHLKTLARIRFYCDAQKKQQIKENVGLDTAMEEFEESVKKVVSHTTLGNASAKSVVSGIEKISERLAKNQETFSLLFSGLSVPAGLYLKRIYEEHGPEGVEAHLNNYLNQCEDEGYQPIEYIIGLGTGTRQEFINHIINQLALNKGQMEAPTTATPYNPEIGEDLTQPDSILSLLNTDDLFDVIYNCAHQSSEPTEDPRHS